jgi:hypothetical protein
LIEQGDGIEVSYRADTLLGRHWVRGVVQDSVRMEVVGQVLLDVQHYPKWMEQLTESRIVESTSADDYVLYNYYDLPWPMTDRDIYVRVRIERKLEQGRVIASIDRFDSPRYPPKEGVIRVPVMQGVLRLDALGRKVTRGEFTELVDLGGSIPDWAKSYLNRKTPAYILKMVRKACRDPFYIGAADSSWVKRELDQWDQSRSKGLP